MLIGILPAGFAEASSFEVCLLDSQSIGDVHGFQLNIKWNSFDKMPTGRIDLVAVDGSKAAWPQFRDGRIKAKQGKTSSENFTVGKSAYPLTFQLVSLSDGAAARFDKSCENGVCSLDVNDDGVTILDDLGTVRITGPNDRHSACN